jgi:hypothetical protein
MAYRELDLTKQPATRSPAASPRSGELQRAVGARDLPDAPTVKEVWSWLEAVVTWLNHKYIWDVADVILSYWPQHPHLVHEIAVLADQRHRAGQALTSDALDEWPDLGTPRTGDHDAAPSQADRFKINRSQFTQLGAQDQLLADRGRLPGPRMSGSISTGDLAATRREPQAAGLLVDADKEQALWCAASERCNSRRACGSSSVRLRHAIVECVAEPFDRLPTSKVLNGSERLKGVGCGFATRVAT